MRRPLLPFTGRSLPALAALLAIAAALPLLPALRAQGTFALDKTSPGTIGQPLGFSFAGATPSKQMLFMLSTSAGPTPLSLLQAGDTRQLSVGLEAASLWFATTTGGGSGQLALPVPPLASLHGASLWFQTLTAPGALLIVDQISNPVRAQLGNAGAAAAAPALLLQARGLAATFFDRSRPGGGDVVLAGGGSGSLLGAVGLDTSEVWSFRTMSIGAGPKLNAARALAVTVPLKDGRTLLCGGVDGNGNVVATAEIYDPATRTFVATGSMTIARAGHAGCILGNGRVVVAGGTTTLTDPVQALANSQNSAEVFDPATGQWSRVGTIASRRLAPSLDALPNGRALLSGGFEIISLLGIPLPIGSVDKCQLYDAASGWSTASAMKSTRAAHALNTVVLRDGRVLVTGGAQSGPDLTQAQAIPQAEIYDPAANTWTALPNMASARTAHSATQVASGRVVVAGGAQGTLSSPFAIDAVEALDPATGTWHPLGRLNVTRAGHGAALTPDGLLVLFGGQGGSANTTLPSIETLRP